MRVTASIAVILSLLSTGCSRGAVDAQKSTSQTVVIDGTRFQPAELSVNVGDSIVWVNKDPFPHTATSATGGFDSGEIASEKSWTFKAVKAGEFPYVCTLHRNMKGILRVK
jgi:plastocyanin